MFTAHHDGLLSLLHVVFPVAFVDVGDGGDGLRPPLVQAVGFFVEVSDLLRQLFDRLETREKWRGKANKTNKETGLQLITKIGVECK